MTLLKAGLRDPKTFDKMPRMDEAASQAGPPRSS